MTGLLITVYEKHNDGINRAFKMHELLDALHAQKKSSPGVDRISYKILK